MDLFKDGTSPQIKPWHDQIMAPADQPSPNQ
jgi:hypothetical protein